MNVNCPKCGEKVAEVQSVARLNLIVHCPFDGHDFGVAVDPPALPDEPSAPGAKESVAGA